MFTATARAYLYWGDGGTIGRGTLAGVPDASSFVSTADPEAILDVQSVAVNARFLFWGDLSADGVFIGRASIDGSNPIEPIANASTFAMSFGVAADAQGVYWTEPTPNGTIGHAGFNGDAAVHLNVGASQPVGIAVDAQHIYWTNTGTGTIGRANLDGTQPNPSFIPGAGATTAIAVDAQHIYWTTNNGTTSAIARANLDGTGTPNLTFIPNLTNPTGVAVDAEHIYWLAQNGTSGFAVGRANLDGLAPEPTFITGITVPNNIGPPSGLAVDTLDLPHPVTPPSITGSPVEGQTLSEQHGSWTNNPTSFTYQWQRCDAFGNACSPLPGGTSSTYTLSRSDIGTTLRVQEDAPNPLDPVAPATSAASGVIQSGRPVNQAAPAITGAAVLGQRLTETHGLWSNIPNGYLYQWLRCDAVGTGCTPIAGAQDSTYLVSSHDANATIRVQETATNAFGVSSPAVSAATTIVPPPPPLLASVTKVSTTGPTARVTLACQGPTGQRCTGQLTLTAQERTHGHSLAAARARRGAEVAVAVGHATFAVAVGAHTHVSVTLNTTGRRLLDEFYKLHARLTFRGTPIPSRTITFAYPRVIAVIKYTASWFPRYTTMSPFVFQALPAHASVQLRCHGPGCPFSNHTSRPKGAQEDLNLFGAAHLLPGVTVDVTVAAPNMIGEVELIRIRAHAQPRQTDLCLVPGVKTAQRCR